MLRAVIFDFDGTILDTETAEFHHWRELYREYGLELKLSDWQQGIGTWGAFDPWAALPEEVSSRRETVYPELRERILAALNELDVRPGVRQVISEAQERGLKLAIASSSGRAWVEEWLEKHDLLRLFPVLATQDDVARVKPDPELYSLAVAQLGVRPEEALALEDSLNGATGAIAAGVPVVVITNDVTRSQPFPPDWPRLDDFSGGLERIFEVAALSAPPTWNHSR